MDYSPWGRTRLKRLSMHTKARGKVVTSNHLPRTCQAASLMSESVRSEVTEKNF